MPPEEQPQPSRAVDAHPGVGDALMLACGIGRPDQLRLDFPFCLKRFAPFDTAHNDVSIQVEGDAALSLPARPVVFAPLGIGILVGNPDSVLFVDCERRTGLEPWRTGHGNQPAGIARLLLIQDPDVDVIIALGIGIEGDVDLPPGVGVNAGLPFIPLGDVADVKRGSTAASQSPGFDGELAAAPALPGYPDPPDRLVVATLWMSAPGSVVRRWSSDQRLVLAS